MNKTRRAVVWVSCLIMALLVGVFMAGPIKAAGRDALEAFGVGGKRVAYIGPGASDQGTFFLFNPQGGVEIQMGAYESGSEKGQTLLGLHGKSGSLRLLLRLHGANDSPVIVMKDKTGDDKLVIGLEGNAESPYIKYRNSKGSMVNLLQQ